MTTGFYRTSEGEKEYSKIGIPYEDSADDVAYKEFLRVTERCPKEKRKREILSLTRKLVGSSGKEFIIWNERHVAFDGIGNVKSHFRGSCGMYPIPVPIMELRQIPGTLQAESYVAGIQEIKIGYSTPFNTKNADSFYKDCIGSSGEEDLDRAPTRYAIEVGNNKITVDSFDDWRNGSIKELVRFGHIASSFEKQRLEDELSGKIQLQQQPKS